MPSSPTDGARPRAATLRDVAERAGVSVSTVSLVVNGRRDARIGLETQRRVQQAVADLGYRTNLAARGLREQRTRTVGFVTDEIGPSSFAGAVILGAQTAAWEHDALLMVLGTGGDDGSQRTAIQALTDRRVDGLVLASSNLCEIPSPESITVPTVLVNAMAAASPSVPELLIDDHGSGAQAARVLLDAGHRHLTMIAGPQDDLASRERVRGVREALAAAGVDGPRVLHGDYTIGSGRRLAEVALDAATRPTGLVCGNDRTALGAVEHLRARGLDVPTDVSLVGIDDEPGIADECRPGLTTVHLPHVELGRRAVAMIYDEPAAGAPRRVVLPGRVVVRDSVAPRPAADAAARR